MKIEDHFKTVVGQSHVVRALIQSVKSVENGGPMARPLLIAEKGNGKSHIKVAYENALRSVGVKVLSYRSPEEIREEGDKWTEFCETVTGAEKYHISFDEAHLFKFKNTRRMDKARAFIMQASEKVSWGKRITFEDQDVIFTPTKGAFLFATNFPHLLDASGALQDRFQKMELSLYSQEELIQILQGMLTAADFKEANETTLSFIARCGRGTARPMEQIVQALIQQRSAEGNKKNSVNRDDVCKALYSAQMFPAGLQSWEVELLEMAKDRTMTDQMILAMMPKLESTTLREGKGYLFARNYLKFNGRGISTSERGTNYLKEIKSLGFKLARS